MVDPQLTVEMDLRAYCHDCEKFHDIKTSPGTPLLQEMNSWEYKHRGHNIEFISRKRKIPKNFNDTVYEDLGKAPWFVDGYKENTNFQIAFVAASALTFTSLASLSSDSSLLAGASSAAVDNGASSVPLEIALMGAIKNGTSPTGTREIDVYAYAGLTDSTVTYPDTIDGTDAAKTITTINILNSGLRLVQSLLTSATSAQFNPYAPIALSSLFGVMPRYWGMWAVHNTGVNLASSGHITNYKGVYVVG